MQGNYAVHSHPCENLTSSITKAISGWEVTMLLSIATLQNVEWKEDMIFEKDFEGGGCGLIVKLSRYLALRTK
jgi:hypothetical protein